MRLQFDKFGRISSIWLARRVRTLSVSHLLAASACLLTCVACCTALCSAMPLLCYAFAPQSCAELFAPPSASPLAMVRTRCWLSARTGYVMGPACMCQAGPASCRGRSRPAAHAVAVTPAPRALCHQMPHARHLANSTRHCPFARTPRPLLRPASLSSMHSSWGAQPP